MPDAPGDQLLQVRQVTKRFDRLVALDDVSLSIRQGEVLGLIGPNGAGKTTLFECLAGLLPADSGTVALKGLQLARTDRAKHLFYVPDGIAPWPSQTLRWAVEFAAGFFGGLESRRREVVGQLDLERFLDLPIGALSKGQRKRALLAIGLVTPHPILLVDEPFDGLDLRQSRDLALTLREHAATGRTLFLSIHQISDAARVCDRFVLLSHGRVRGEGALDELARLAFAGDSARRPDLEEVFLALA
jgi:ABC-2 type transport system ATP-binding protein